MGMTDSLDLISTIADELNEVFWDKYDKDTIAFPDTEDGMKMEIVTMELAIVCIVNTYLMHFKKFARKDFMEELITNIRDNEKLLPDSSK